MRDKAAQAVTVSRYLSTRDLTRCHALRLLFGIAIGGVMPLYAILVREYFGARLMGNPARRGRHAVHARHGDRSAGRRLVYDTFGSYFWLDIGSFGIGLGAMAIAICFLPPRAGTGVLRPAAAQQAPAIRGYGRGDPSRDLQDCPDARTACRDIASAVRTRTLPHGPGALHPP